MGNACTHITKRQTRMAGEAMGMKGSKNSETHDEELETEKKEVLQAIKSLEKMVKEMEDSQSQHIAFVRHLEKFHMAYDLFPASMKATEACESVDNVITTMQSNVVSSRHPNSDMGVALIKKFIHECDKTTRIEYKLYNDARVEYDLYRTKMKKKLTDDKRDENELKLEKTKEVFDLRKDALKKKMTKIIETLPLMYETASVGVAAVRSSHFASLSRDMERLNQIITANESKLHVTVESLELNKKIVGTEITAEPTVDATEVAQAAMTEAYAPPAAGAAGAATAAAVAQPAAAAPPAPSGEAVTGFGSPPPPLASAPPPPPPPAPVAPATTAAPPPPPPPPAAPQAAAPQPIAA